MKSLWEGIVCTLINRAFGPHRDSRYVRHVVLRRESRVDGAGHDPNLREEVTGELHIAHK